MGGYRRKVVLVAAVFCSFAAVAQTGSIQGALPSWNDDCRGTVRQQQYVPRADAFFCLNGANRFTRALYGGPTQYRLETSDRPVFALFNGSKSCRNVQLHLIYNNVAVALDSTDVCEATYGGGVRTYRLTHAAWGPAAALELTATCLRDSDACLWRFCIGGFGGSVTLRATLRNIVAKRLSRNGDIGADKPGVFEADGLPLATAEWAVQDGTESYLRADGLDIAYVAERQTAWHDDFCRSLMQHRQLAQQIRFSTPDPYINAIDEALVMAADGAWDGDTWLHGAIGWRMPLAGWRAGYLGDVMGWPDRARSHFDAYAESQVTQVEPVLPHPTQDSSKQMARAEKRWGTQMYSNGYICRNPHRNDQMHHYDMNLNYVDELLWHLQWDADTAYMRRMWPVLQRHLEWERRNFDPDGDHLYDAYCCIWASDALYYSGGAVTHASAYNLRANRLAAQIAARIGQDPAPYASEAEAIMRAMDSQLWTPAEPGRPAHWAEYRDKRGMGRLHGEAALWSIYTPIDCGVGTDWQTYSSTLYVDSCLPHLPVTYTVPDKYSADARANAYGHNPYVLSTSTWMPYSWSINNVASAEIMNTVTAMYRAGRSEEAFRLLKGNILDQMYLGQSPGNLGQLSHYDAARGECYRDFSDNTGTSARALLQGLFGIVPQALDGRCIVQPGLPAAWDSASVSTPYLSYRFRREASWNVYEIRQHFSQPLTIVLRQNLGQGRYRDHVGTADSIQVIRVAAPPSPPLGGSMNTLLTQENARHIPTDHHAPLKGRLDGTAILPPKGGAVGHRVCLDMRKTFNANVDDIFKNRYLSPRPQTTTLQIPVQGVGEWCHPEYTPQINDSVFRSLAQADRFSVAGVTFATPQHGHNIAYTSLWDNYPDSITVKVRKGRYTACHLLMAGSTNHMQTRIENAIVTAIYADGTQDTLRLVPPYNWCPIEQDYYVDGLAFSTTEPRPYRVCLGTGQVSRDLGTLLGIKGVYGREIPGGAAQMLTMPLHADRKLTALRLRTLSDDVVVGLMAVTLEE